MLDWHDSGPSPRRHVSGGFPLSSTPTVSPRSVVTRAPFLTSLGLALAIGAGPTAGQTQPAPSTPATAPAPAASKYLAAGFTQLPRAAKVLVMPVDVELFSLSAGGVAEPRADWTATALGHLNRAMSGKVTRSGLDAVLMDEVAADEFAEQIGLHAAVARSIALHHGIGGTWALPPRKVASTGRSTTRCGRFRPGPAPATRSSPGSATATPAPSARRRWWRWRSSASDLAGGSQVGYASLVDLETGRVLWFNRLARASGDLREEKAASESLDALLIGFPGTR